MRPFVSLLSTQLLIFGLTSPPVHAQSAPATNVTNPIQHIVVIFQENVSFGHYFGTYPVATNPQGSPVFTALPNTPAVNGLSEALLTRNANAYNTAKWKLRGEPRSGWIAHRSPPPIRITTIRRSRQRLTAAWNRPSRTNRAGKDTVRAHANMVTRFIARFEGHPGRYVWHCHVLEHEDNEMMRPFTVLPK